MTSFADVSQGFKDWTKNEHCTIHFSCNEILNLLEPLLHTPTLLWVFCYNTTENTRFYLLENNFYFTRHETLTEVPLLLPSSKC